MTLSTRSSNRMSPPAKKPFRSPVVKKQRRSSKANTPASKKKKLPHVVPSNTRTILHYFSPSSQTDRSERRSPVSSPKTPQKEGNLKSKVSSPNRTRTPKVHVEKIMIEKEEDQNQNLVKNHDSCSKKDGIPAVVVPIPCESKSEGDTTASSNDNVDNVHDCKQNIGCLLHEVHNDDEKDNDECSTDTSFVEKQNTRKRSKSRYHGDEENDDMIDVSVEIGCSSDVKKQKISNNESSLSVVCDDVDGNMDAAVDADENVKNDSQCDQGKHTEMSSCDSVCHGIRIPSIGDVARMVFHCNDLFVNQTPLYCIGKIVDCRKESDANACFQVKVLWSDQVEEEYTYPNSDDDLEILVPKKNSDSSSVYISESSKESMQVAFDPNPKRLQLGDLVQCYYQNGLSKGQWWPGRVAKVHAKENRVDVAYLDGEYEIGIPLHQNKINFLESGIETAAKWLVGAEFTTTAGVKSKGRKPNKSKVSMVFQESDSLSDDTNSIDRVKVIVENSKGKLSEKSFVSVYTRLVSTVYKRNMQEGKVLLWPDYKEELFCKSPAVGDSDVTNIQDRQTKGISNDNRLDEEVRALIESDSLNCEDFDLDDDSDLDDVDLDRNGPRLCEMKPSLGNACWRNLQSSEPQNGYGILSHVLSSWKYMPNENLNNHFSNFLLDGPLNDNLNILEPYRTELSFSYLERVQETQSKNEQMIRPTFVRLLDIERLLEIPPSITCKQTSKSTVSDSHTCRIAKELQLRSMAMNFSVKCISSELRPMISGENELSAEKLLKLPFTSRILRSGTRDCLKLFVRTFVQFMMRHSHFLMGAPYNKDTQCSSSPHEQICAFEAQGYIQGLGMLISYTAWMLSFREKTSMLDPSLCCMVRDVLEHELDHGTFNLHRCKKKSEKDGQKKNITLQFLFALETSFSREFQNELAKLFNLQEEFHLVALS